MAAASRHSVRNFFIGQGPHHDHTRSCSSHAAQLPSQLVVSRRRAEVSQSQEKIVIHYIKLFNLITLSSIGPACCKLANVSSFMSICIWF